MTGRPDNHAIVLDAAGLARLFEQVAGQKLVGAIDCDDCVEIVFDSPETGANLVTIFTSGNRRGNVYLGFVCRELIDDGYGRGGAA